MLHVQRMSITDILTAIPDELVNKGNMAEMFVRLELLKKRHQIPFGIRCALEDFSSFENVKNYLLYPI